MALMQTCPCCGKSVEPSHFSCHSGHLAGSTTGDSKRRGGKAYYKAIQAKSAATRKRNNALRRKAGEPLR